MMTKILIALLAILELVTGTNEEAPWHVRPTTVVFRNQVLGLKSGDSQCTPLGDLALDTPSKSQYVSCEGTTRITDSSKSLPAFTQDSPSEVYIWGQSEDRVLFTFSGQKNIHSLAIHYYSNSDNQGLPKLRFYAMPEDFQVQDEVSSYPIVIIDEARPGREQEGLRNKTRNVTFQTSKILMTKSATKNYQFYVSEVEFFTNDIDSVDIPTTTASTTEATTTSEATTVPPTTLPETTTSSSTTAESTAATTTAAESTTTSGLTLGTPEVGGIYSGANSVTPSTTLSVLLATLTVLLAMTR